MERFVAKCNIIRFERMLREASDPAEQRLLEEMLAEERLKLSQAEPPDITEPAPAVPIPALLVSTAAGR